jgi:SAM-dependent methyltransferase
MAQSHEHTPDAVAQRDVAPLRRPTDPAVGKAATAIILAHLARQPRLRAANAAASAIPCKVCRGPALFFDVVDFNKCAVFYRFGPSGVAVAYYRCDNCGFLFTPFCDAWSHDDFARLIYNDDYVLLDPEYLSDRPIRSAELMASKLAGFESARILDYGAGKGLFAQRMAELGFRGVESYDPFSIPRRPEGHFDIVTCFEVIEHIPSPIAALADIRSFLADHGCIVLGESVQPPDIDRVRGNWWYVAPRNGHVSTFADRTLATLADQLGMVLHRGNPHAMVRGTAFAALGERFGRALACFRLGAPGQRQPDEWYDVEPDATGPFQWTAAIDLTWRVTAPSDVPRQIQVMVPFAHESRAGFAEGCTITIDGRTVATSVRESCVFAESSVDLRGEVEVALRTPELSGSPEKRLLGLAVRVLGGG